MTAPAIHLQGVWKSYPRWAAGSRTLRAIATRRMPLLATRGERRWVLRDVSLDVAAGRAVGLIGPNGAGKSTLLRLASGLGRPTRGTLAVPPRAASVLTLGDTFDLTLSGRENAMTAAVVTGWSRAQAREIVPAALEFAELQEFADAPVRTYSDGMKLRLAFGVVAQLQPDALLLDEVMVVGDLAFQAKCMQRVREMREAGAALLLAAHDLRLVERECEQALWLEEGEVMSFGDAGAVVAEYERAMHERTLRQTPAPPTDGQPAGLRLGHERVGTQQARIEALTLRGPKGGAGVLSGEPLEIRLSLRSAGEPVLDPIVAIRAHREHDDLLCLDVNTGTDGVGIGRLAEATVTLSLDRVDLAPGRYLLDAALYGPGWETVYDFHHHAYVLEVSGRGGDHGVVAAPRRWEISRA